MTNFRTLNIVLISAVLLGGWAIVASPSAPSFKYCKGADSHASDLRTFVIDVATNPDADTQAERAALHVPLTVAGKITQVSSESRCQKASSALDGAFKNPVSGYPVYLFKVDTIYAAAQAPATGGLQIDVLFLNSKYKVLGLVRAPWY